MSVTKLKCNLENDDVVDLYRKCYLSGPALFIIDYQGLEYGFAEDIMVEPRHPTLISLHTQGRGEIKWDVGRQRTMQSALHAACY